jgi:hypothetical protein
MGLDKRHANLKQTFHLFDPFLIHEKQNNVVLRHYNRIMVRNDHLVSPYD